jgi:hypothetical protein
MERPIKGNALMKTTITRLFDRHAQAKAALQDLIDAGVPREDISIVANASQEEVDRAEASQAAEGAGAGAGIGGVIGCGAGILAGLGVISIPGIGPVVAAGWLAAAAAGIVAGAAAGAAAGGILGALMAAGVSEQHATIFVEGIRRGGTLLTVRIDEAFAEEVRNTLDAHGPFDPDAVESRPAEAVNASKSDYFPDAALRDRGFDDVGPPRVI